MTHKVAYQTKEDFKRAVLFQPKKVLALDTSIESPISGRITDILIHKNPIVCTDYAETWSATISKNKQNQLEVS